MTDTTEARCSECEKLRNLRTELLDEAKKEREAKRVALEQLSLEQTQSAATLSEVTAKLNTIQERLKVKEFDNAIDPFMSAFYRTSPAAARYSFDQDYKDIMRLTYDPEEGRPIFQTPEGKPVRYSYRLPGGELQHEVLEFTPDTNEMRKRMKRAFEVLAPEAAKSTVHFPGTDASGGGARSFNVSAGNISQKQPAATPQQPTFKPGLK